MTQHGVRSAAELRSFHPRPLGKEASVGVGGQQRSSQQNELILATSQVRGGTISSSPLIINEIIITHLT